jgi:hypothetical protein
MTSFTQTATLSPFEPDEGEAVVYGVALAEAPDEILYVGATTQHPAVRVHAFTARQKLGRGVRYVILEITSARRLRRAESKWIKRLKPPMNANGGGGRLPIDKKEARRLYREGLTCRQVAEKLGCHHSIVARCLRPSDKRARGHQPGQVSTHRAPESFLDPNA